MSIHYNPRFYGFCKAENNLSAKQYYIVEYSGSNQVDVCNGAGDVPFGVLQNEPAAGEAAKVAVGGVCKVITDGTVGAGIAAGDFVGTHSDGKAIIKSADADYIIGMALEASSADLTVIPVDLDQRGQRAS